MEIVVNQISFHDCPVRLREKCSLDRGQIKKLFDLAKNCREMAEVVVLQTCNRVEFYSYVDEGFNVTKFWLNIISQIQTTEAAEIFKQYVAESRNQKAVKHLFELVSGLDSQMLGENQIMAQIKDAYAESVDLKASGMMFHKLFHMAFRTSKFVRSQTQISSGAVSVPAAAVEVAKQNIDIEKSYAMIIGAGFAAENMARLLAKAKIKGLIVANRTIVNAEKLLANIDVASKRTIKIEDIADNLADVQLVMSAVRADCLVIKKADIEKKIAGKVAAGNEKIFMIDVAVPRNIDPAINDLKMVTLLNIDDLSCQVNQNKASRQMQVPKTKKIIEGFVEQLANWHDNLDVVPLIQKLNEKAQNIAATEIARYGKEFTNDDQAKLQAFAQSLMRKVMHGPIAFLKQKNGQEYDLDKLQAVDLIGKIFLDGDQNEASS